MLIWSPVLWLISASASYSRTAASAALTVRSLRNSSGPVTKIDVAEDVGPFGVAMMRKACHSPRTGPSTPRWTP